MSTAKLRQYLAAALLCAGAFTPSPLAAEPAALRGYNAPIGDSSISGISSGAFMAVQFGTAWSSVIKGVGVVAGGPYWCAKADAIAWSLWYLGGPASRAEGPCMKGPASELTLSDFTAKADTEASAGGIDPLDNLGKFSESEASNHMPSLADFTTTTPELKFSVHTGSDRSGLRCRLWMPARFPRASNPYRTIFETLLASARPMQS
jgi:hypothetical protein